MADAGFDGTETVDRVVVYDGKDGRVIHVHDSVTLPGGHRPSKDDLERTALSHARKRHADATLHVLQVNPDEMKEGTSYRVDPAKRQLIAGKVFRIPQ
jgi:hypothetical protein